MSTSTVAADMAVITAGFNAKLVEFGVSTVRGTLHQKDVEVRDEYQNSVLKRATVLHVAAAHLATATIGKQLTVDGVSYLVHDNRLISGGAIRELILAG